MVCEKEAQACRKAEELLYGMEVWVGGKEEGQAREGRAVKGWRLQDHLQPIKLLSVTLFLAPGHTLITGTGLFYF